MEALLPIDGGEWEELAQRHFESYPQFDRNSTSLRRKFNTLANHKKPTGDANCPPTVRTAKRLQAKIMAKSDAVDEMEETELLIPSEIEEEATTAVDEGVDEGGEAPSSLQQAQAQPQQEPKRTFTTRRRQHTNQPAEDSMEALVRVFTVNALQRQQAGGDNGMASLMKQQLEMQQMMQQQMMQQQQQQNQMMMMMMNSMNSFSSSRKRRCRNSSDEESVEK